MAAIKFSRQRESIKNYLAKTKSHPSADDVYMHIRESFPNISLGTVYRNLNFLLEQGEVIKLMDSDGNARYDGNVLPHYHFSCRSCKRILDINTVSLEHINTLAAASFEGEIEGHITLFYGLCPECRKRTDKLPDDLEK